MFKNDFDLGSVFDSTDDAASQGSAGKRQKVWKQRTHVSQFDHVSVQGRLLIPVCLVQIHFSSAALNPTGESQIGSVALKTLWNHCSKGNKAVKFHSNLCSEDSFRQGVGISQAAECLLTAFSKIKSKAVQALLREDVYEKVKHHTGICSWVCLH